MCRKGLFSSSILQIACPNSWFCLEETNGRSSNKSFYFKVDHTFSLRPGSLRFLYSKQMGNQATTIPGNFWLSSYLSKSSLNRLHALVSLNSSLLSLKLRKEGVALDSISSRFVSPCSLTYNNPGSLVFPIEFWTNHRQACSNIPKHCGAKWP